MSYKNKVSELFLNIESKVGTSGLSDMAMSALMEAIHDFKEKGEEDFFEQFYELFEIVKNTQPRIALVIDAFYEIWEELLKAKKKKHPEGHLYWERKILKSIRQFRSGSRLQKQQMTTTGAKQINKGDVILIHGISGSVISALSLAKKKKKKFRVIIAEQEAEKTHQMIELMNKSRIPFQVIPEYMLSHIEKEVTKVFLGAVTINSKFNVVADAGTNAIVSEFHLRKTPIYLFFTTRKFSLWESSDAHHTYKVKSTRTHTKCAKPISFERIKFSHDRIPLRLYDVFVTENGKMNAREVEKLFKKKFKERDWWRNEFF